MKCPDCRREIGLPPVTCGCGARVVACGCCAGRGVIVTERVRLQPDPRVVAPPCQTFSRGIEGMSDRMAAFFSVLFALAAGVGAAILFSSVTP